MSDQLLCSICLSTTDLKSIFKIGKILGRATTLAQLLEDLISYKISAERPFPHYLCSICMIHLVKAYKFQQRCVEAYKHFDKVELSKPESVNVESKNDELETVTAEREDFSIPMETDSEQRNVQYVEIIEQDITQVDHDEISKGNKCEICGKVLKRFSSYKYHMQTHSDAKMFKCSQCDESFNTRNAYEGHIAIHEEKHTCKICNKLYRQAASLRSHMLTHTGEKPWKCDICGKGMTQKSGFKKHMLTHIDVKPHTCEYCNKTFKFSSNLFVHLRSHTGERNYECKTCSKKFTGSEQLKRHVLIHTGEKPFKCSTCNRSFNRRSALKVHEMIHLPDKKFKCPNRGCDRGFNQPHSLKNHIAVCGSNEDKKRSNTNAKKESEETIVVYEISTE